MIGFVLAAGVFVSIKENSELHIGDTEEMFSADNGANPPPLKGL